jgi:nitroreductase
MQIPSDRWYPVIQQRRSRRVYDPTRTIPADIINKLQSACLEFRPFPQARAELHSGDCDAIFRGAVGTYGKIKGAGAFIAFIGDISDVNIQEKVGYIGEAIILEATALGLATCWVGGFFRPGTVAELLDIGRGEKILGVTPVGYAVENETWEEKLMAGFGRNHERLPLSQLVTGLEQNLWPEWIRNMLEAARLSPSAINRQPWHFHVEPDAITVSVRTWGPQFTVSKRLDCGIAMLHLEVAALHSGVRGKWEFMEPPKVAYFKLF